MHVAAKEAVDTVVLSSCAAATSSELERPLEKTAASRPPSISRRCRLSGRGDER